MLVRENPDGKLILDTETRVALTFTLLIVIALVVSTTVPLVLTVLICTWNVSGLSTTASIIGVTVNCPALFEIVKLPLETLNSLALVTVQYNVVAFGTAVVATLIVTELPSLTENVVGVAV